MERLKIAKKPLIIWLLLMLVVMIITIFMTRAPLTSVPFDAEKVREANFDRSLNRTFLLAMEIMFDLFGCFMIILFTWQNGNTKVMDMTPKQKYIRNSCLWLIIMTGINFMVIVLHQNSSPSRQSGMTSQAYGVHALDAAAAWGVESFVLVSGIMAIMSVGFIVITWLYHRRLKSLVQQA